MRWRWAVTIVFTALGLAVGLVWQGYADPLLPMPCEASEAAGFAASDLSGFVLMGSNLLSSPGMGIDRDPAIASEFRAGRTSGFLASVALQPAYRQFEDDVARRLGYHVGTWPLVPLTGPVVQDHSGPLEIYLTVEVFRSSAAPKQLLQVIRASGGGTDQPGHPVTLGLSYPYYAYATTMGPDDGTNEHDIGGVVQVENVLVQVDVRGGVGVGQGDLARLLLLELNKLNQQCNKR